MNVIIMSESSASDQSAIEICCDVTFINRTDGALVRGEAPPFRDVLNFAIHFSRVVCGV